MSGQVSLSLFPPNPGQRSRPLEALDLAIRPGQTPSNHRTFTISLESQLIEALRHELRHPNVIAVTWGTIKLGQIMRDLYREDGLLSYQSQLDRARDPHALQLPPLVAPTRPPTSQASPPRSESGSTGSYWVDVGEFTAAHRAAAVLGEHDLDVMYSLENGPSALNTVVVQSARPRPQPSPPTPAPSTTEDCPFDVEARRARRRRAKATATASTGTQTEARGAPATASSSSLSSWRPVPRPDLTRSSLPVQIVESDSEDECRGSADMGMMPSDSSSNGRGQAKRASGRAEDLVVSQPAPVSECTFVGEAASLPPTPYAVHVPLDAPSSPTSSPSPPPSTISSVSMLETSTESLAFQHDTTPSAPPISSISAAFARPPLPSNQRAGVTFIPAPSRPATLAADLPPPYTSLPSTDTPLQDVPPFLAAPAPPSIAWSASDPGPSRPPLPPSALSVRGHNVATLCTPDVAWYLYRIGATADMYVTVHKCIFSHSGHGARKWRARMSECGLTEEQITQLINLFPHHPRSLRNAF
ncbi:hypothetical protein C8Q76DRAFT_800937 [Earliella scabrosa]|nr:hypothetical protein C8Q76DRAFT_800937 [Earliella scabrosa]